MSQFDTGFELPNLDQFDRATDEEKRLANKYARIRPCCVKGDPEACTVWLKVGNQMFRLDSVEENEVEASWTCWMLAKAIGTIFLKKAVATILKDEAGKESKC